jgi:hypothetical protein
MNSLFQTIPRTLVFFLIVLTTTLSVRAQEPRIQLTALDHLASRASETVDVNIDERLIQIAAKIFNDKEPDEAAIKKLVSGLKGIYVKSFEFDKDNEYSSATSTSSSRSCGNPCGLVL